MRTYILLTAGAILVGCCIPVSAAAKDLTLRQRVTSTNPKNAPYEATKYMTADRIVTDAPATRTIIDLDAETYTVVNMGEHTYLTLTFWEARQAAETLLAQSRKAMEEKNLPPPSSPEAVSARPTGKTDTIVGYPAQEYEIEAAPVSLSVWATTALQPPGGEKARQAAVKMTAAPSPSASVAQALAQIEGVVLRTSIRVGTGPQDSATVTDVFEIIQTPPPAEALKVPAGFKQAPPSAPSEPSKSAENP